VPWVHCDLQASRQDELCIGINRGPQPDVSNSAARLILWRQIPLFAADESPALIDLNPAGCQIAKHAALVIGSFARLFGIPLA
jgi:hypothetical protein